MLKVFWSPEAKNDYWDNIDYLLEEFPTKVAKDFIAKTETLIHLLRNNNLAFRKTSKENVIRYPLLSKLLYFTK